jgi:hypothetical protein
MDAIEKNSDGLSGLKSVESMFDIVPDEALDVHTVKGESLGVVTYSGTKLVARRRQDSSLREVASMV